MVNAFNMCGHVEMHHDVFLCNVKPILLILVLVEETCQVPFFTWVGTVQLVYQIMDKTNDRKSFQLSLFLYCCNCFFYFRFIYLIIRFAGTVKLASHANT